VSFIGQYREGIMAIGMKTAVLCVSFVLGVCAGAQLVISGNENKIDLTSGEAKAIANPPPDSISILDFSVFPPNVHHIEGITNSVIGPPSNIAVTPDGGFALIASSVVPDPQNPGTYVPDTKIRVLDLFANPPVVIQEIEGDKQPSGLSITSDGALALVANRAAGTVSVLTIEGGVVSLKQNVKICEPEEQVVDIAIGPQNNFAIAAVCKGRYLAVLRMENGTVVPTGRKFSVFGEPYRCVITPDGAFALTGGAGRGHPDADAITVVDLRLNPAQTVDYVAVPSTPESIEISPDGKLLAAVLMAGSNLASDTPGRTTNGRLALLARRDKTFALVQTLPTGAIPEGVAFSPDGQYIIVQCHPSKELWVYQVSGESATDTGVRIAVPGMPSSLRAHVYPPRP
jgi:DNA-binding beta-propeller fold protein YncE